MKRVLTPKRALMLFGVLLLLSFKALSCDGSASSCGGTSGGMRTLNYAEYPVANKINNLGMVRLTGGDQGGIAFIEAHAMEIIKAAVGGSLTFSIPEAMVGDSFWGSCKYCIGNCNITLDVDHIDIVQRVPNTLTMNVFLPPTFSISVPASCGTFGSSSWVKCTATADTNNKSLQIAVDLTFDIDNDTRQLNIQVGEPQFDLNSIDISLDGPSLNNIVCKPLQLGIDIIRPLLTSTIKSTIKDAVGGAVDGFKCLTATDTTPCPALDATGHAVSTDSKKVCRKANGDCLLKALGVEYEIDVGQMLASTFPGLSSKLWVSYAAGGRAEIVNAAGENGAAIAEKDLGTEIGLYGGSMMAPGSPAPDCNEIIPNPSYQLARVPMGNTNPHVSNAAYHAGIAIREEMLDQIGITLQNSGLLCLTIDPSALGASVTQYLSPGMLSVLMPSINKLIHSENPPMYIKLSPGLKPIDFSIHNATEVFSAEVMAAHPTLQSGLGIHIKDFNINFLMLLENRLMRFLTLEVDIDVIAGLGSSVDAATGGTVIDIALDKNNLKISNMRVPFTILGESAADRPNPNDPTKPYSGIISNLSGLIGVAMGQIPMDIKPIAIPAFDINGDQVNDLAIRIQSLSAEIPKTAGTPTEYKALGVYAQLVSLMGAKLSPIPTGLETYAVLSRSFIPTAIEQKQGALPSLTLALSGRDADGQTDNLEYQYAVDGNWWSFWSRNPLQEINDPNLALPGRHVIKVRSRDQRFPAYADLKGKSLTFVVDNTPPTVSFMQKENVVYFLGKDNVSTPNELSYRARLNGGEWSLFSSSNTLSLAGVALPAVLDVQVKDGQGLVSQVSKRIERPLSKHMAQTLYSQSGTTTNAKAVVTPKSSVLGCQSAAGSLSAGLLLLGSLVGLFLLRRRQSRGTLLLTLTLGLMLVALGCSSSSHRAASCTVNAECKAGEACVNQICQPITDGDTNEVETPPDGDEVDTDKETEADDSLSCTKTEDCPGTGCYTCSKRTHTCLLQTCSTTCDIAEKIGMDTTPCNQRTAVGDTCAQCVLDSSNGLYGCQAPRCKADTDCDCRQCGTNEGKKCDVASGLCVCSKPCRGGCDEEKATCCLSDNQCKNCLHWCEGKPCEAGYQAGVCNPEEDSNPETCSVAAVWKFCNGGTDKDKIFSQDTCSYTGLGLPTDPSCDCVEKPKLPMGAYGRFLDLAQFNNERLWFTTYNETYGDLLVGTASANDMQLSDEDRLNAIKWTFLDGVPNEAPTNGPTGPRGGISGLGPNVGKYTALALSSEGWPRIAYQDADNASLLFVYTDGETQVPVDGDEEADETETPADGDSAESGDATTETPSTKRKAADGEGLLAWSKFIIDDTGVTGLYNAVWMDPQGRPVIAYQMATDQPDGTTAGTSALKLAWAKVAKPKSADDFVILTIDQAPVGPAYCAPKDDGTPGTCTKLDGLTPGIGLNPTIAALPDGQLWLFYYQSTTFETRDGKADNYKVGILKRAKLNGTVGNIADPSTASFSVETFLGTAGTLVVGDVGLYNSFDTNVADSASLTVVAFYNATLNQLQYVYTEDNATWHLRTADDGWRKDANNHSFQVRLGADANVKLDNFNYVRIVYQDMSRAKLLAVSESCQPGSCGLISSREALLEMSDMLDSTGNAAEWGQSYGYYAKQVLLSGVTSVVGTYAIHLFPLPQATPLDKQRLEIAISVGAKKR